MKSKLSFWELALSIVLVAVLLAPFGKKGEKKDLADFDLGLETTSYTASFKSRTIHIRDLKDSLLQNIVQGWEERGKRPVVLCVGNSQTHSLNQYQKGQNNYVEMLAQSLDSSKTDVIATTLPNANLQEMYLIYSYWKKKLPIKYMLIPAFLDDMREDGLREILLSGLVKQKYRIESNSETAKNLNAELAKMKVPVSNENNAETADLSVQERVEKHINDYLDDTWPLWNNRSTLRGDFFIALYEMRNKLLGINANTKRKRIPAKYQKNRTAFIDMMEELQKDGVKVIVYIPPLRKDVEPPYEAADYSTYIAEITTLTAKYPNVTFLNLDNVVPGNQWGLTQMGLKGKGKQQTDFMHFQYGGHQQLFHALQRPLDSLIHPF